MEVPCSGAGLGVDPFARPFKSNQPCPDVAGGILSEGAWGRNLANNLSTSEPAPLGGGTEGPRWGSGSFVCLDVRPSADREGYVDDQKKSVTK